MILDPDELFYKQSFLKVAEISESKGQLYFPSYFPPRFRKNREFCDLTNSVILKIQAFQAKNSVILGHNKALGAKLESIPNKN